MTAAVSGGRNKLLLSLSGGESASHGRMREGFLKVVTFLRFISIFFFFSKCSFKHK